MSGYRGGTLEGLGGPVNMDPYSLGGIDPTLDACCRREVESNRKYNALTSTLRRHDLAALAERRRRNLVTTPAFEGCRCCYDPNSDGAGEYRALIEYKQLNPVSDSVPQATVTLEADKEDPESDDSDDEFDYLLDEDLPSSGNVAGDVGPGIQELEEARRAELEYQMMSRQVALQHGYGTHRAIHPGRVLKIAGLAKNPSRSPPPAVVLHLVDPDSTASASLDYYLETELAARNAGTIFVRSGGRSTLLMDSALANQAFGSHRLQPDRDMPALVAIRDGVVIAVCPQLQGLSASAKADSATPIEPRAVEQWLEHADVLRSQPPQMEELCFVRPEEDALMDYLAQQKASETTTTLEQEFYDCGLDGCCKTFPHEHVGIQTETQSGLMVKEETILGTDATA